MTIKECIDIVDNNKPNQYTIKEKVMWLSFIDEFIINEVLKTHEGYDGRYDGFEGYSEDKLSVPLIVPSPYDRLYTQYLKMKIDEENGETTRYNNSMVLYNSYMLEFRKYYNKTHMPLDFTKKRDVLPSRKSTTGLSEAEYENIKRDLTYFFTELFSDMTSDAKLYDIVTKYMKLNGISSQAHIKTTKVNLLASNWVKIADRQHIQIVAVEGATKYSKVDLQPTMEQLVIFDEKDISFSIENNNGTIMICCIGQKPTNDYVMQATITEVVLDE